MGVDNLNNDTQLYRDMYICTEYLHCSHEDFLRLPKIEKKKLQYYLLVQMKKREKEFESNKPEMDMSNAPELRK